MTLSKELKKVIAIETKARKLNESMAGIVTESIRFERLDEEYLEAVQPLRGLCDDPQLTDEWMDYCQENNRYDVFAELIDVI